MKPPAPRQPPSYDSNSGSKPLSHASASSGNNVDYLLSIESNIEAATCEFEENIIHTFYLRKREPKFYEVSQPGRSTTEAIHLLRSLIKKYRERQRDLHMAFLDLEKVYDSIPRELVWRTLIDKGAPGRYLRVLRDMYEGAKTRVRTSMGDTKFFPIEVGLHQGSAISPYLFALILDEISRGIQEDIPWCMIFADDIVLIAESAEGLNKT
ncbi:retrovirus-related pol polyprotein LINE-1 [Tanacetum coccineum]